MSDKNGDKGAQSALANDAIAITNLTPEAALLQFQTQTINEDLPKQRFSVCRIDGVSELRKDIIEIYKKPDLKLKAIPKVRFEEEDGIGSGPVREFLVHAIKVVDEGIPSDSGRSKPLIFFEGESGHRLPVHDQSLRLTGTFRAVGRILGHSMLHGGPGLHGLSPAVKHILTTDLESHQLPVIVPEDISDMDLRSMIAHHVSTCVYLFILIFFHSRVSYSVYVLYMCSICLNDHWIHSHVQQLLV